MTKKFRVKIKNSIFPVRINGVRYHNGKELIVDEIDLSETRMEVLEEIKEAKPQKQKDVESE